MSVRLSKVLILASMLLAASASNAWTKYTISIVDNLPLDRIYRSQAIGINKQGHVLILTASSGPGYSYQICRGVVCSVLANPATNWTAYALNDLDQVAGSVSLEREYAYANGSRIGYDRANCPSCGFGQTSFSTGINNLGEVAGTAGFAGIGNHAFKYTPEGGMVSLGTLGGSSSEGRDINMSGNIVGSAQLSGDLETHAFLYAEGVMTDLGTLGGQNSWARGLNFRNTVVGCSLLTDNLTQRAFRYQGGVMVELPSLSDRSSCAHAVNNKDVAVGYNKDQNGAWRGVIFKGNKVKDLNSLIQATTPSDWFVGGAVGINAQGKIIANGSYQGYSRALLLTPIVQ